MDIELVERARSGDHEAFSALVRAATPRLYTMARLILRDPNGAEDAVQEALMLAWRQIRALRDPQAWDAWLNRLTARACVRLAQTQRRHAVVELRVLSDRDRVGADFAGALADRDDLGRALERLPVEQRAVMVLHFYVDLPLSDAADALGIPVGTAKSRLHRGLATLRLRLAGASSPERSAERPA
jgi:RNA polymerase sigma-70 factor (ECF subfamily)